MHAELSEISPLLPAHLQQRVQPFTNVSVIEKEGSALIQFDLLSRLMKDGTGKGFTDTDHPDLANQLYAAYARATQVRVLASVVGSEGLTEIDRLYLRFGEGFEGEFANQGNQRRALEQSMAIGWRLLSVLPRGELHRLSDAQIAAHIEPLRTTAHAQS